jgi:hypothetical protein
MKKFLILFSAILVVSVILFGLFTWINHAISPDNPSQDTTTINEKSESEKILPQKITLSSWEVSTDKRTWKAVSLPDTGWGCDDCTRYYRAKIEGKPKTVHFRWASDNKTRLFVNEALVFDEFWKGFYCTDKPCCSSCCDTPEHCSSALSVWRELDTTAFIEGTNTLVWEVYEENGGEGFYVEMKLNEDPVLIPETQNQQPKAAAALPDNSNANLPPKPEPAKTSPEPKQATKQPEPENRLQEAKKLIETPSENVVPQPQTEAEKKAKKIEIQWTKDRIAKDTKEAEFLKTFKPRPECKDPNLEWAKTVQCINEKTTAREHFYNTH